jgi:hypothetical protein
VTESSTRPPEIVRRQLLDTSLTGVLADHVPDGLFARSGLLPGWFVGKPEVAPDRLWFPI